jgi:hypothetical protein
VMPSNPNPKYSESSVEYAKNATTRIGARRCESPGGGSAAIRYAPAEFRAGAGASLAG